MTSDRPLTVSSRADAAFVDFYLTEHDGQVRRAYLLLGDSGAAHDVVATAFVSLYERWDRVEQPGPYLNRCVLNECRDSSRKTARERTQREALEEHGESDRIDELVEILAGLPFRQRAAIILRFYAGWSEQEIAQHLKCRPGTVGSLIHRGLRALRHLLTTEGPHSDR